MIGSGEMSHDSGRLVEPIGANLFKILSTLPEEQMLSGHIDIHLHLVEWGCKCLEQLLEAGIYLGEKGWCVMVRLVGD